MAKLVTPRDAVILGLLRSKMPAKGRQSLVRALSADSRPIGDSLIKSRGETSQPLPATRRKRKASDRTVRPAGGGSSDSGAVN